MAEIANMLCRWMKTSTSAIRQCVNASKRSVRL